MQQETRRVEIHWLNHDGQCEEVSFASRTLLASFHLTFVSLKLRAVLLAASMLTENCHNSDHYNLGVEFDWNICLQF